MSKFDKKTIATVLAFAALLGNKTSATTINPQTVGAAGAASSNSEKLKKTQGMGIGAGVAIGTAALVGAYATANEILGDTGLVNHPAMGRFTAKKTIEYWMRDVKKEEELIDRIIEFIDNSGVIDAKEEKLNVNLPSGPNKAQNAKINKATNAILMEKKDLISNIKIDNFKIGNCSISLENEEEQNKLKLSFLPQLKEIRNQLDGFKSSLSIMGLSGYSVGILKFDLSKNSIFIGIPNSTSSSSNITMLGNAVLTLNNDDSLTIKFYFKKFTDLRSDKSMDNVNYQITISDPKK